MKNINEFETSDNVTTCEVCGRELKQKGTHSQTVCPACYKKANSQMKAEESLKEVAHQNKNSLFETFSDNSGDSVVPFKEKFKSSHKQ